MAWQILAAQLGIRAGMWLLNKYILSDEKKAPRPRPEAIEFQITQTGARIPYVYGTVRVDSPPLVWIGNQSSYFSTQQQANVYRADQLFVLGVPPEGKDGSREPPTLRKFWYGDQEVSFTGPTSASLLHGQAKFTGNSSNDGNFCAAVEFFDGRKDQTETSYPSTTPASWLDGGYIRNGDDRGGTSDYRYQMLMAVIASEATGPVINIPSPPFAVTQFAGRLGTDPHVKAIAAEVRARGYNPPATDFFDANPAYVLYDLVCGLVWKLGLPSSKVDFLSFDAAAAVLEVESHGCSVFVNEKTGFVQLLAGLLDQIDAVMYEDQTTGVIKLRLIRGQDATSAPTLDADVALDDPKVNITSWQDAANHVDVTFTNRSIGYKQDIASADRLSVAVGQDGRPRPRTVDYPFCMNAALASKLAARELAVAARPVMSLTVPVNRIFGSTLEIGDVIKVNLPAHNIVNKVFRVADIDGGQLTSGAITLSLMEDVFSQLSGGNSVTPTPDSAFLLPIHERYHFEAPYYMEYARSLFANVYLDRQSTMTLATNTDDARATRYYTEVEDLNGNGGGDDVNVANFVQLFGTLAMPYPREGEPYDQVGLYVDMDAASDSTLISGILANDALAIQLQTGQRLAVIVNQTTGEHEWITFEGMTLVSGSRYKLRNVWRGIMDTPAIHHVAGARFMLFDPTFVGRIAFATAATASRMIVPEGSSITGPLSGSGDDPTDNFAITMRSQKPIAPVNMLVIGAFTSGKAGNAFMAPYYKRATQIDETFDFIGTKRLRTYTGIILGTNGSQTPETGTTYDLAAQKVYPSETASPETEVTILSGLTDPQASGVQLGAAGFGEIDVKLRARKSPYASHFDATARFSAARFRNLLKSGHACDNLQFPTTSGWTASVGTITTVQATTSLTRRSVGISSYIVPLTASANVTTFFQDVDVSGFLPEGMSAIGDLYYRGIADSDDTINFTLTPLNANGSALSGALSLGSSVVGNNVWKRGRVTISSLPAGTVKVRFSITCTGVTNSTPLVGVSDISLRLGRSSGNLISNGGFNSTQTAQYGAEIPGGGPVSGAGGTHQVHAQVVLGGNHTNLTFNVWCTPEPYPGKFINSSLPVGWSETGWFQIPSTEQWDNTITIASATAGTYDFTWDHGPLNINAGRPGHALMSVGVDTGSSTEVNPWATISIGPSTATIT